jgi:hypothetical protein
LNTWDSAQYFLAPLYLEPSDLQIVFGNPIGTQTTLDIPPSTANYILHGPVLTGNDTLLSENATQTVQNKNLTAGTEVNGCGMTNGPGTYLCIANNSSTATLLNSLAVLTGEPSTATVDPRTAINGVVGIVTAGAGITGNAIIQQSGAVNCNFDGAASAGDYVGISSFIPGDCTDLGATYPFQTFTSDQVLGRVLVGSSGSGLQQIDLELSPPLQGLVYSSPAAVLVDASTTELQAIESGGPYSPSAVNAYQKTFLISGQVSMVVAAGTGTFYLSAGSSAGLGTLATVFSSDGTTGTFAATFSGVCVVYSTGSSGGLQCSSMFNGNSHLSSAWGVYDTSVNLTVPLFLGTACDFTSASGSNSCTEKQFVIQLAN